MEDPIIIFFTTGNLVCSPHNTVPKVTSDLLMTRFSRLLISHCPQGFFFFFFPTLATIKACFKERICLLASNSLSNLVFWQFCFFPVSCDCELLQGQSYPSVFCSTHVHDNVWSGPGNDRAGLMLMGIEQRWN